MKLRILKKKRQLTLKCRYGREAEPPVSPYFIPALCREQSRGSKDSGIPRIPSPTLRPLSRSRRTPPGAAATALGGKPWCQSSGKPGALRSPRPASWNLSCGSLHGRCLGRADAKKDGNLRRAAAPARRGHPPGTACALPPAWNGGASGKSQLHRAAAGRSRQASVGDAPNGGPARWGPNRAPGDRGACALHSGHSGARRPAPCGQSPSRSGSFSGISSGSCESPSGLQPRATMSGSFVIPRAWQGVFLEKYSRKASCVHEPVGGLLWGVIVGVSFSFQRAKRSVFNFGYSHFRYLK